MSGKGLLLRIACASTFFFLLLQLYSPSVIQDHIEGRTYDLRLRFRELVKKTVVPGDVVVVAIDDKSIREIGRWPWRRDVMAGLVSKIAAGGPKAIGIDIMFTEPETSSNDRELGEAILNAGNVVLATPFQVPLGKSVPREVPELPAYMWNSAFAEVRNAKGIKWRDFAVNADGLNPPVAEIARGAVLGHVYSPADTDGVLRWELLYLMYGDDCFPSFPLQVARVAMGIPPKDLIVYGGAGIEFGKAFIPTNLNGKVLINYAGSEHTFPYICAADLLRERVSPGAMKGRIVLVGTSALATYDQRVTPLSADMPGVEKNATVVNNIISNNFIRPSPGVVEAIVIVVTGLILGLVLPGLRALQAAAVGIGFIALYISATVYFLVYQNLWLNLVYPSLNMITIFTVQTVMRFAHEERQAKEIRRMFSSYVSPKIVRELIEHPEKAKLGGIRKTVTILFADVIGFTTFSEKRRPEDVVMILNEFFDAMSDVIFRWEGTLDKFVGDEIMVIWGAPLDQPDHAQRAVGCATDMSRRLDELQKAWAARGIEGLDCGIGINTGEVVIGNIGAEGKKMDYTAIGDEVNLAARVEKLTRQFGRRILITGNAHAAYADGQGGGGEITFTELGEVTVKGKNLAVRIYGLE
ncbi:MAG: adenylate/guanylate cyclase domain-containing protein [Nitrospiraceae bacterium]|nr:adenylate/guanylate cyclase domain-containing protein [Nitrospiraceae bacterium]